MPNFPSDQSANGQTSLMVFLDPGLQIPATMFFSPSGLPVADSILVAAADGTWPLFSVAGATVLYAQDDTGQLVSLHAAVGDGTPVATFTGSRSGAPGPLLEQIIQAGIAAGLPWVDNTTA